MINRIVAFIIAFAILVVGIPFAYAAEPEISETEKMVDFIDMQQV